MQVEYDTGNQRAGLSAQTQQSTARTAQIDYLFKFTQITDSVVNHLNT